MPIKRDEWEKAQNRDLLVRGPGPRRAPLAIAAALGLLFAGLHFAGYGMQAARGQEFFGSGGSGGGLGGMTSSPSSGFASPSFRDPAAGGLAQSGGSLDDSATGGIPGAPLRSQAPQVPSSPVLGGTNPEPIYPGNSSTNRAMSRSARVLGNQQPATANPSALPTNHGVSTDPAAPSTPVIAP